MCNPVGCASFCVQPQIWMAAVAVDSSGGISAGQDTSFPAFWLPFQEVTAHNHIAQWVEQVPGEPPPVDAGVGDGGCTGPGDQLGCDGSVVPPQDAGPGGCGGSNAACGAGQPLCCAAFICASGHCTSL
jgi:hypothetical protein